MYSKKANNQHNKVWDTYFLARYDTKTDYCIGVYENIEQAVRQVYGYSRGNKKYISAKNSIIASYSKNKRSDGHRRSAKGIWYKIKR